MGSAFERITRQAQGQPVEGSDPEVTQTQQPIVYPDNFANLVGWLAALNTAIDNLASKMSSQGIDARNIIFQNKIRDQMMMQYVVQDNSPEFLALKKALNDLGISDPYSVNTSTIPNIIAAMEGNAPDNDQNSQEITNQLNAFLGNFQPQTKIEQQIKTNPLFQKDLRNTQLQKSKTGLPMTASKTGLVIVSQQLQDQMQEAAMPVPEQQPQDNPLQTEKFKSMDQLKQTLINMGPTPDTYTKIFELVGPDNEDSAKSSLAKFFAGSPAGLSVLYDLLIKAGAASPVDEQIVGDLMSKHPQVFEDKNQPKQQQAATSVTLKKANLETGEAFVIEAVDGKTVTVKNDWDLVTFAKDLGLEAVDTESAKKALDASVGKQVKVAGYFGEKYMNVVASYNGLYLPPGDSSCQTMEKVASGGVGGTPSMVYQLYGPEEKRMCPKIRNVVSTFTCRYHCLDGLAIDDHQILCGEAIWRRNMMDKFSSDYVNKDGKLEGGYIRDRFEVENNTHEHPALLKPGQRMHPINEDAWSTEKRLVEVRKEEGDKRGYAGVYEPTDVYNFDQHKLVKGPEAPELAGKEKDPIAKLASTEATTKEAQFNGEMGMGDSSGLPGEHQQSNVCGEECPICKAKYKTGTGICKRCNVKNKMYYRSDALQQTKAIPKPTMAATVANGVYKVTINGKSAFGPSVAEAQAKLAPEQSTTIQDTENQLTNVLQKPALKPAVVPPPIVPVQPQQPVIQQVPTQIKSPMLQQQPQESQNDLPIIPPAIADMGEGEPADLIESDDSDHHISAEELDSHLDSHGDPINEIQERTKEFAQYGLGPKSEENR